MRRLMVAGFVAVVIGVAGCSSVTTGTPMADPDQTGITTTTTTTAPRTTSRTAPSRPDSPTAPPAPGMANTTCGEYVTMDEDTKKQVIAAIGEGNELISINPEMWVGLADMMCTFVDKSIPVKEAVMGQGMG